MYSVKRLSATLTRGRALIVFRCFIGGDMVVVPPGWCTEVSRLESRAGSTTVIHIVILYIIHKMSYYGHEYCTTITITMY